VLEALVNQIAKDYPDLELVGAESPPFRDLTEVEQREQIARIHAAKANVVWLGLGTPKQDFEAARIARGAPVVAIGVGAAFDFVAGSLREAPRWMQRSGLEWLFRLVSEPRRLWRRYTAGSARFVAAAMRYRSGG
jgi:N-acetylglucosaminyldiphosphoundecaprenol N-acetyl-beta-D-mannosaminyltransferase